ncbi:MAG: substrate-binding domain-containing protein [Verrucomicrobiota bacterium]
MSDRRQFLRRAGAGAAGFSLAQLLGPAAAPADDGGGDYPAHPRWKFVFVSHDTLDPLLVATQFGAQDAAALVRCTMQWTGSPRASVKETVAALRSAISHKADGIAVAMVDEATLVPEAARAKARGIPLVAFNVGGTSSGRRYAYVGENPHASGAGVGAEIARLARGGTVVLFAPGPADAWAERRLKGVFAGLAAAPKAPAATVVRLSGDARKQQGAVEAAYTGQKGVRGLFAVDGIGTLACGRAISHLGLRTRGVKGGGYDLLPDDLALVADGSLDFVVDQQPYVQGFTPVMQLFLAKISQGTVIPWDTETSVLLRRNDVRAFLATKSRFEGSSSLQAYPLRRG